MSIGSTTFDNSKAFFAALCKAEGEQGFRVEVA